MEEKIVCIYHSRDLDGWMSAAIIKMRYPNAIFIGWDYGQELPLLPQNTTKVVMVDVSFPMVDMVQIAGKCGFNMTWIDHHISAIKAFNEFLGEGESFCLAYLNDKYAACELTWTHFFRDAKMPEIVRLLGRYDCFGHKGTDEEIKVLEFQYGARQSISCLDDAYHYLIIAKGNGDWSFDEDVCSDINLQGKAIYKYLCTEAQGIYKRKFDIILDGYKFACVNQERFNPINFGIDYHKEGYDGFACFHYANGVFNYSLYSDNGITDCSVIAKNRGGGGHMGASGFRSKEILNLNYCKT